MIRTLTIVEDRRDDGQIDYQINGNFPLDEAARALVVIAFNAPKPELKKE
jgi:hypothetical protein